jgi:DNA-binding GntR family transcriptional regulator
MTMASLSETARRVRKRIMDQVLAQGTCPKVAEIARELSLSKDQLEPILRDLEAAICVAVQKDTHARLDYFQEEKLHEPVPEIGEIFYATFCRFQEPLSDLGGRRAEMVRRVRR